MLIKETKTALGETNSRTRGNSTPRRTLLAETATGCEGDGVHAQDCLRRSRGCGHSRVLGACTQPVAAGRGRRAVGDRQGRSRRCTAAGRRLLGTAVALYGSQLPARYAQPARVVPRSQVRADAHFFAPAAGGCRLALTRTRICSLPWYSPAG